MPSSLLAELVGRMDNSIRLAEIGEVARAEASRTSQTWANLHPVRLEALYEVAYLRMFVSWEVFLEEVFLRYLCGYASLSGAVTPRVGVTLAKGLTGAEAMLLGGRPYKLWHNPATVVARSQGFFTSCPMETVVDSYTTELERFAAIRHRITHGQSDARKNFDAVTMAIVGKRYRGARPGAFLRDLNPGTTPPTRWLHSIGADMTAVAGQIV
jgi:hypothetical protein